MSDPEIVRTRTCHGWAFRDLPGEELVRVKAYLQDGDPRHLEGTSYKAVRAGVIANLSPRDRKLHKIPEPEQKPAEPLTAEELRKLVPAAADVPQMHVEMVDGAEAQLILVVKDDGSVIFKSKLTPEDLLHLLHHVVMDVEDTIRRRDAGMN